MGKAEEVGAPIQSAPFTFSAPELQEISSVRLQDVLRIFSVPHSALVLVERSAQASEFFALHRDSERELKRS